MPALSNVRAGRVAAIFAKFQSAFRTAESVFTTAHRCWSHEDAFHIDSGHEREAGMQEGGAPSSGGTWRRPDRPAGGFIMKATPATLRTALDSNWGPFAAGAWTLAGQNLPTSGRWLTLALCENARATPGKVVRMRDAWLHRVTIAMPPRRQDRTGGMMLLDCEYAARKDMAPVAISGGGVTLPSSPMQPANKVVFPRQLVNLTRDPDGDDVALRFDDLRLTLSHGVDTEYDMGTGEHSVWKGGNDVTHARLEVEIAQSDEAWEAISESLASTPQDYVLAATAEDGTDFTVRLHDVLLQAEHSERRGLEAQSLRFVGEAAVDSDGDFVDLALA